MRTSWYLTEKSLLCTCALTGIFDYPPPTFMSLTLTNHLAHPIPHQQLRELFEKFFPPHFWSKYQNQPACWSYIDKPFHIVQQNIAKHCIVKFYKNFESYTSAGKPQNRRFQKENWPRIAVVAGWKRYEGAFSPVPEKYGWANGNYFEAQRGRWAFST